MLITYQGRQYQTLWQQDALTLAVQLGIGARIAQLNASGFPQYLTDRALWEAILARVGKGVLAGGAR